jgi:hypothetical protein
LRRAFTFLITYRAIDAISIADKQYEIAKAIAKTARRSEERLSRFESIAHYSKGTR